MNTLKKTESWATRYLLASGISYRNAEELSRRSFLEIMRAAAAARNEQNRAIARRFVATI